MSIRPLLLPLLSAATWAHAQIDSLNPANRPPEVSLEWPAQDAILRRDAAYTLSARASDPDLEAVSVTFLRRIGQGSPWTAIGTVSGPPHALEWIPDLGSVQSLRAQATDPHGATTLSDSVEVTVTGPNQPPGDVVLTAPAAGASFASGQAIQMAAYAEDGDPVGPGISRVEFYHDDTLIAAATAEPFSATWTGGTAGIHSLKALAYDNHSPPAKAASAAVSVIIRPPNAKPAVSAPAADPPGPLVALAATSLRADAGDADGHVVRVAFYDNGTPLGQDTEPPFAWRASALPAGTHRFSARAFDNAGDSSDMSPQTEVKVSANQPPVARAGRDTFAVRPANTVVLDGSASGDPEGSGLLYRWSAPQGSGVTFSDSTVANPTVTLANTGVFPLTLVVTDSNTPPASATDQVLVSLRAPPAITSRLADTATTGIPYSYAIAAAGFPAPTVSVGTLPAGLTRSGNTLSGTPEGPGGNLSVTLTATNEAGTESRTLALTLRQAPVITLDLPESHVVEEGRRVTFAVAAAGFPAPAYQWQKVPAVGGAVSVGGNASSLVLDSAPPSAAGGYRVVVSNPSGTAISRTCRLEVAAPIRIRTQPLSIPHPVVVGRTAAFQVRATGAPTLLYQWFRDGIPLGAPAAGDSDLVLGAVKLSDAGLYRVRITNPLNDSAKGAWSDTARLGIILPKIDKPKASPAEPADYGQDGKPLVITLATDTPSTAIRYTTDGSTPTAATGILYDAAAKPTFSRTSVYLLAKAFREGYQASDLFAGTYAYVPPGTTAKPKAWPQAPVFLPTQAVSCTLKTTTPDAIIRYTLDGSNPKTSSRLTYTAPFPLTRTVTVTAYATGPAGFVDSDTLVRTYTLETPSPKAQAPEAVARSQGGSGRLSVVLASSTDSASILYTLDGSSPESSPTRQVFEKSKPIPVTTRTVLKAQTTAPGHLPSEVVTGTFVPVPGPITAKPAPAGGSLLFDDTVRVRLSVTPDAPIWYTLNDSLPLDGQGRPVAGALQYTSAGIRLGETATITAMALADGAYPGSPFRLPCARRGGTLNTPLVATSNGTHAFKDSLRVSLSSTAGSTIRFTRDGSDPASSGQVYRGPFTVDTTVTIRAVAEQDSFLPSGVLNATFTLEADTPRVSPRGGSYFSGQRVVLSARSRKTPIRYTLNGTLPGPGNGLEYLPGQAIHITAHAELKAVALSGGRPGPVREESYRINRDKDTLLLPGETCFLEGGYSVANPPASPGAVRVTQGSADGLDLRGFEGVQSRVTLAAGTATNSAAAFPGAVLTRSASESRCLYKAAPDGRIYFVSGEPSIRIAEPGDYFMGRDAMPPVVTLREERVDDSGFTVARLRIEDNVRNLLLGARRADNPVPLARSEPVVSDSEPVFRLRHGKGVLKALLLQVTATDFANQGAYPGDGRSWLPLSQELTDIRGGGSWRVGVDTAKPYDLVGVPLQLVPPLTVADIGESRSGQAAAFIYDNATGKFRPVPRQDTLVPGQAYWLSARSPLKGFHRASARLKGAGTGAIAVRLAHGWNQVASPHLDTLYWPASSALGEQYRASPVKRLWEYTPLADTLQFTERDELAPWKGYYVFNHGGDTLVQLLDRPPVADPGFLRKPAADPGEASLLLAYGDAPAVTLAASPGSLDEAGREDEGLLPAIASRHRFRAVRQGRALSCDWIRFRQDAVLRWSVLSGSPGPGSTPAGGAELPAVRVLSRRLPEGYQAWAVSRKRGMKFLLEEGGGLPASGLPDDTLLVVAGPAAKLAGDALLRNLSLEPPSLALRVLPAPGGPELLLDLPGRSRIRATLWNLRGASLGELDRDLAAGHYRFRFAEDFRRHVAGPAAGVHFLRLEIASPGVRPATFTRKVIFKGR